MRFMQSQDGTWFNVDHIVTVGPANTVRGSKGYGPYLMVALSNGSYAVPLTTDGSLWHSDQLDLFLKHAATD